MSRFIQRYFPGCEIKALTHDLRFHEERGQDDTIRLGRGQPRLVQPDLAQTWSSADSLDARKDASPREVPPRFLGTPEGDLQTGSASVHCR
jgi:hypothetical protein